MPVKSIRFSPRSPCRIFAWWISATLLLKAGFGGSALQAEGAFPTRDPSATVEGTAIFPPYTPRFWAVGDDPARNVVQAIAQTPDGFLWLGTQGGLMRFDGEQFERINITPDKKSPPVYALVTDETGALWVGTTQGLFQWQDGSWDRPALPGPDKFILSLRCGGGALWVGTRTGLALYRDGKFSLPGDRNAAAGSLPKELATDAIRCLTANREVMLAGAGENVIALNAGRQLSGDNFHVYQPDFIRSICSTRDGSLWVGGNSGVIQCKDGKYTRFSKTTGLPDNGVTSIYEDRRGNLWIGTFGGLCRYAKGKFVIQTTPEGEQLDQIFCFFEDAENNLWVGAKNGLYQLSAQQFITYTTRNGLAHNNVISVYEGDDGAMWIGTWGGGLHCLRDGKITVYSAAKNPAMANDLVLAIAGSQSGGIWFAEDYNSGLYRLRGGEVSLAGQTEGLARHAIRAVLEQGPEKLWVGYATHGLSIMDHGRVTNYGTGQGLPANAVRCLAQAHNGGVWVGTEGGLCLFTNGGFATFTRTNGWPDDIIYSVYEDKAEHLWVGTSKGLCRTSANRLSSVTRFTFFEDAILEILEDDFENLWLATRRGVLRVSKKELNDFESGKVAKINFVMYDKADGMASQVCVGVAKPSAFKSKDGRLWFATTRGLAVTGPNLRIPGNERPPPVVIETVVAGKHRFNAPLAGFAPGALKLGPDRGDLEFHYNALSYAAPEKNRFKYRLEGWETDWIDAGSRHTAFYNNTPPGEYTFRVIACNDDGVWNETGAAVQLTLEPHFWQTTWCRSLAGFAGIVLVAGGARYATRKRLQHKLQRLEQQHAVEKERTRIAQDIHDDIGATLTRISYLGELTKRDARQPEQVMAHAERVCDISRGLTQAMDEIVWAVNPQNDNLRRLAVYIFQYAEEFLSGTELRLRKERPKTLPEIPVNAETRHNLFLVVKEALNNVVKHAKATELRLSLTLEDMELHIGIEDNGCGFSPPAEDRFSNGLKNMRKRIEEIGGGFRLEGRAGEGTMIKLTVPLAKQFAASPK